MESRVPDPMTRALACIAAAARELPLTQVETLASALETLTSQTLDERRIEPLINQIQGFGHRLRLQSLFKCLRQSQAELTPVALAWALRGAAAQDAERREQRSVELVWTGPPTPVLKPRLSYGALLEVIDHSRRHLTIASFAVFRIDAIRSAILRALARGVAVRLILESASASAGKIAQEPVEVLGLGPHAGLETYVWPLSQRPTNAAGHHGALHMKCALADEELALISSANLTGHALELNMELGVLLRDAILGAQLRGHFDALIQKGILRRNNL